MSFWLLDVSSMTPLEAITKLYEIQERARVAGRFTLF